MNKNTAIGLVIVVAVIIAAVALWRFYLTGPPQAGPAPETISKPSVTPPPAVTPPAAPPAPQQPAQAEPPGAPPIKTEPPQGIAPLQEPSPPASKIAIPPPPEMKEHFGILVDDYRNYRDAAKMQATLKKQGKPAFVQRDAKNPNNFQVWVGPFSSQAEAQAAEKDLQALLKKPLKIERIENLVPK